jgi:hypothetical protein
MKFCFKFVLNKKIILILKKQLMKKFFLLTAFGLMGLVSAKNQNVNAKKQYRVTIKTVCGTTYQTIFDDQFDSGDCLYNEWEMYNNQDCGHASYENPIV